MLPIHEAFEFDYFGSDVVYGRGAVGRLDDYLATAGFENAMVVCGTHVGATDAVMDPVRAGLGDRLCRVFAETTPTKTAETVYDGIDAMREAGADVLVGLGGGSSLDVARQISAFAADGRSLETFREVARAGDLDPPDAGADPTSVVVIPTTFAGADMAVGGKVALLLAEESPTGETVRTGGAVRPTAMVYDPSLFETTPAGPLLGSAMNGFDKPVETLYARNGDPIIQGVAMHSLRLFRESLPAIPGDPDAMDRAVVGAVLAQFRNRISLVHAFGQAVSRQYPVHQGEVHAAVAPHALRYLFEHADANRELLARGLGVDLEGRSADEVAAAVVTEVSAVRDGLGLPSRLRDLEAVPQEALPAIAEGVLRNRNMAEAPVELDPTAAEIEAVLRAAW